MISQVAIVPTRGHTDDDGKYDPGYSHANASEIDLVHEVARSLEEELELENIRYFTLDTGRHPGVKVSERWKQIPENSLVIHIAGGWCDKLNGHNCSSVSYGHSTDIKLAKILMESMSDWGQTCVFGHQRPKPIMDKIDPILSKVKVSFRIEPLYINGPHIEDYWPRLPLLGRDLALSISHWLKERDFASSRPSKEILKK